MQDLSLSQKGIQEEYGGLVALLFGEHRPGNTSYSCMCTLLRLGLLSWLSTALSVLDNLMDV